MIQFFPTKPAAPEKGILLPDVNCPLSSLYLAGRYSSVQTHALKNAPEGMCYLPSQAFELWRCSWC